MSLNRLDRSRRLARNLTVTQTDVAEGGPVPVTFEKGARAPSIFTAEFIQFPWGTGLDNIIPNFADPGVGGEDNPFIINVGVPEPASLALVAFGGLALLRRRRYSARTNDTRPGRLR